MTLGEAVSLASRVHALQLDKCGKPYIFHPIRVAMALGCEEDKILGVLHDVLEDSDLSSQDLLTLGLLPRQVEILETLTRRRGESYDSYIDRIALDTDAIWIKIADLDDNLREDRRFDGDIKWRTKYTIARDKLINSL